MFKRSLINRAVFSALLLPGAALAEVEISGYIKNETAVFSKSGQVTGEADTMLDDSGHNSGDVMKFENSARMFANGDLGESSSWHADVNVIYNSKGANKDYQGYEIYTQYDWLRELYVDTTAADWDFRLGKQQVVWGTADGIKLLDIINPTDYRELVQNTMEDSRIPIWMLKAERNVGDTGNVQFIVSQVEENKIPGLNKNGDSGQPFIMKGVDTITGQVNGFYNIAPALSNVAASFNFSAVAGALGPASPSGLVPFGGLTVQGFAGGPGLNGVGYIDLNGIAQGGVPPQPELGNDNVTNLMDVNGPNPPDVSWNPANPKSAFEYMSAATFATFNTFTDCSGACTAADSFSGIKTKWDKDYPDDTDTNLGFRYKGNLESGFNYSVNYFYHYSANPDIDLSWHDPSTGEKLRVQRAAAGMGGVPNLATNLGTNLNGITDFGTPGNQTTILLRNSNNQYYGAFDPTKFDGTKGLGAPELRFTESLHRMHSIGTSFDYALDGAFAPIVLRGEFLYDKDDTQAVVDKRLLAVGDLSNALTTEEADYFKYVLGVDVTVLKNLLVSGQFIQFRNLDYQDTNRDCKTQPGINLATQTPVSAQQSLDCSKYTGDLATLSLDNGMNKARKNKEFYSMFLSKPFGPSDEHRWNNIVMYEEGGGWWNRFDVEYSFTDNLIGNAEWNQYWGDEDTQFGQFENSSNVQLGVRYLFD